MLVIRMKNGTNYEWLVTDREKPEFDNYAESLVQQLKAGSFTKEDNDIKNVSQVYASGDELTFIWTNFSNLPMRNGPNPSKGDAVSWFGSDAQFIAANL